MNEAASEVAVQYGEPEIYSFSWSDYCGQGMNNFEVKMLMVVYLDSLEVSLDSMALEYSALDSDWGPSNAIGRRLSLRPRCFKHVCLQATSGGSPCWW